MARRDEGAYCSYVTEEQRSQSGCIGREGDRLSHSQALSQSMLPPSAQRACRCIACLTTVTLQGALRIKVSAMDPNRSRSKPE